MTPEEREAIDRITELFGEISEGLRDIGAAWDELAIAVRNYKDAA